MHFFANKPEILGGSQTFIGVLLTFIVLCLFSSESNFLLKLICNMVADFTANLKDKIEEIKSQIDQEKKQNDAEMGDIANNRSYWANQSKTKLPELYKALMENNKEEQNIRNSILEAVEPEIKTYKESDKLLKIKNEHKFVSLYFLILMLIVMTVDACCVSGFVGTVFLSLECVVTFYFTGCLWYRYVNEKVDNAPRYNTHTHIWGKVLLGVLTTTIVWFLIIGMSILPLWILWVVTLLVIILAVAAFSHWLMYNFRYTVRYNNQFIIKHSLYIAFVCMIVTLLIFCLCNIEVEAGEGIMTTYIINLQSNMKNMTDCAYWVRIAFVLLCAANTFFIPLLLGYFYNHNKAMRIKKIMNTCKDDIINRLKNNNQEYQNIVKTIQEQSN